MTEKLLNILLKGVFDGSYNLSNLPVGLYEENFSTFKKRFYEGYDSKVNDEVLHESLMANVESFTACKTFQNVNDLMNIIQADPLIKFDDFKELGTKINHKYNYQWMDVESDFVHKQGISVKQWQTIEETKDVLPLLKYETAGDERVRDEHKALDGIVRPVGDKFWSMYFVPNGYRCRCAVIQLEEGEEEVTVITKKMSKSFTEDVPMMFRINPSQDGYLFVEKGYGVHPYFVVPSEYESEKNINFGLPKLV